jgi:chemotaxis protein MotB
MAGEAKKLQPIIVKKIKKGGHAHHGGAWKIAYADFVTAMMAFFLLMWLLGSTAQGDLKGIADYFSSPLKVAMSGGSGSGDSSSIIRGGGRDLTRSTGQTNQSDSPQDKKTYNLQAAKAEAIRGERARLQELKEKVEKIIGGNAQLAQFAHQIKLDITTEGLRIQIIDEHNRPMFDSGQARMKDYTREILREVGRALAGSEHKVSLSGHTDASPFPGGAAGYGNWELSTDRANAARRELLAAGLDDLRVLRVVGLAASVPLKPADPYDAANRRISIIVMNRAAELAVTREGPTLEVSGPESAAEALAHRPVVVPPAQPALSRQAPPLSIAPRAPR